VHEAVGRLRLATGDAAEAEAAYRQALAIVPHSPDALIGLAAALAAGGRTEEAESTHLRAIESQPRYAATHIAYGNFLASQGRLADAVAPFERATVLAPDNPSAFNNLGGAQLFLGAFEKAGDAFARSLAIEPRRASYSNAGSSLYYQGRFREAAGMYRKAIELAPADHRLWGNLGDALRFDSGGAAATEAYRRALEVAEQELVVNPRHAVNRAHAAYYASRVGDENRVRAFIAQALADGEDNYYVHYYVALAELGLGNESAALIHARRARQLGYPEALLQAAPELGDIRNRL
jgi:Tfp pilus assembly protein PilF